MVVYFQNSQFQQNREQLLGAALLLAQNVDAPEIIRISSASLLGGNDADPEADLLGISKVDLFHLYLDMLKDYPE